LDVGLALMLDIYTSGRLSSSRALECVYVLGVFYVGLLLRSWLNDNAVLLIKTTSLHTAVMLMDNLATVVDNVAGPTV